MLKCQRVVHISATLSVLEHLLCDLLALVLYSRITTRSRVWLTAASVFVRAALDARGKQQSSGSTGWENHTAPRDAFHRSASPEPPSELGKALQDEAAVFSTDGNPAHLVKLYTRARRESRPRQGDPPPSDRPTTGLTGLQCLGLAGCGIEWRSGRLGSR
jgi:hypothetical protein